MIMKLTKKTKESLFGCGWAMVIVSFFLTAARVSAICANTQNILWIEIIIYSGIMLAGGIMVVVGHSAREKNIQTLRS